MPHTEDDFYDEALPPLAPKWSGPLSTDGLGPIFVATYESGCAACLDTIQPGEDARSDGHGGWIHADDQCEAIATAVRPTNVPRRQTPCPQCFTIHAGECA
jgi:hypothetical protein